MGLKLMPIPTAPHLRFAGMLSEAERSEALEAATVVVAPSPAESLALLALESFAVGTPVLANARSDVLVDHCQRSNAGLYYADRDEFQACLRLLVRDDDLRTTMGRQGRAYVRANYRWDVVLGKYDRLIAGLPSSRPARTVPARRPPPRPAGRADSPGSPARSPRGGRRAMHPRLDRFVGAPFRHGARGVSPRPRLDRHHSNRRAPLGGTGAGLHAAPACRRRLPPLPAGGARRRTAPPRPWTLPRFRRGRMS